MNCAYRREPLIITLCFALVLPMPELVSLFFHDNKKSRVITIWLYTAFYDTKRKCALDGNDLIKIFGSKEFNASYFFIE